MELPLRVTLLEFYQDVQHQKATIPMLSCGIVCVMLSLAILIQHWFVRHMDGRTDGHRAIAYTKLALSCGKRLLNSHHPVILMVRRPSHAISD